MKTSPISLQSNGISDQSLKKAFRKFILDDDHPCIMAQSTLRSESLQVHALGDLHQSATIEHALNVIREYIRYAKKNPRLYASLALSFAYPAPGNEKEFEKVLWQFLQRIHAIDPEPWDESVSADPTSENFSFSILGHAFYMVGMHPQSSRPARRFPQPVLVFNLHSQFDKLRKMKVYQKTRDRIRKRDKKKNGSVNPMLSDFGHASEARQYSGRKVDEAWKCPFLNKRAF